MICGSTTPITASRSGASGSIDFSSRRALSSAAGLVTVTLGWAEALRRRYRQPISCIFNGYVAEDFPAQPSGPPPGDVVSIVYTGTLYSGDRDPSASFSAINLLGAERDRVVVHFYGPPREQVQGFAMAHGVVDRVFVHDPVSYKACLALQTSADILLLLQWNPKQDEGHVPAKLFEYLGARRPILLLGYEHGEPAEIIRKRGAGFVADDPPTIARQLRTWIAQRPTGIPPIDPRAREGVEPAPSNFSNLSSSSPRSLSPNRAASGLSQRPCLAILLPTVDFIDVAWSKWKILIGTRRSGCWDGEGATGVPKPAHATARSGVLALREAPSATRRALLRGSWVPIRYIRCGARATWKTPDR